MKIICVGRNYVDHIKELSNDKPTDPVIFIKPDTALLEDSKFYYPSFSTEIHYELELVFKIGKVGKNIEAKFAHKYIDSYGLGIDFTARDLQSKLKEKGLPWEKAKAFDGSAIIGDFLPKNNFSSTENITFELKNNGTTVQKGNTSRMLWKIDEIVSYVSQYFTLKKGDVIFTGTPEGVAKVSPNDVLEGFIEDKKVLRLHIK